VSKRGLGKVGMSLVETLVIVGVLGTGAVMMVKPIENLSKSQKSVGDQLEFDRLMNEVSELLSDPLRCTTALEELTKHSPKFCDSAGVAVRVTKDLGKVGPSVEDQILVPFEADTLTGSLSGSHNVLQGAVRSGSQGLRGRIVDCKDVDPITGQKPATLEIKGSDAASGRPIVSRSIALNLKYEMGEKGALGPFLSCTSAGQKSTGASGVVTIGETICKDALGGSWDPLKTPHCQTGGAVGASSYRKLTDLPKVAKNAGATISFGSISHSPNIIPTQAIDPGSCDFKLHLSQGDRGLVYVLLPRAVKERVLNGGGKTFSIRGEQGTFESRNTQGFKAFDASIPVNDRLGNPAGFYLPRTPRLDLSDSTSGVSGPLTRVTSTDYHSNLHLDKGCGANGCIESLAFESQNEFEYRCTAPPEVWYPCPATDLSHAGWMDWAAANLGQSGFTLRSALHCKTQFLPLPVDNDLDRKFICGEFSEPNSSCIPWSCPPGGAPVTKDKILGGAYGSWGDCRACTLEPGGTVAEKIICDSYSAINCGVASDSPCLLPAVFR